MNIQLSGLLRYRCGTGRRDADRAIEARNLGRAYGSDWALQDCTLDIPVGCVTGLVGPNGAGKTTLLNLATGMLRPSSGSIRVLGGIPGHGTAQLRKVGFVAQETPVYAGLIGGRPPAARPAHERRAGTPSWPPAGSAR